MRGELELLDLLMAVRGALGLLRLEGRLTWTVLQLSLLLILPLRFRASPGQTEKDRKGGLRRWDRKDPQG